MIYAKVLIWDEDEKRFVITYLPYDQIISAEEEMGGKLVVDPNLIRGLHIAFVRYMKEHGHAPDVVRCTIEPLMDFFYKRVSIKTPSGDFEATNCNLYFSKPRAIIAA